MAREVTLCRASSEPASCQCLSLDLGYMGLWWFIFIVYLTNLLSPRRATSRCVCNGVYRESNWRGKICPKFRWHHHDTRGLRENEQENGAEPHYAPPSASWLEHHVASCLVLSPPWLQSFLSSRVPAVIDGDFKINPVSLQLLLSGISHSDEKKMPSTGSLWHCCIRGLWEEGGKKINGLLLRDFYRKCLVANILMSLQNWKTM